MSIKKLTIEELLHELGSKHGKYTGGTGIGLVSVISATLTQFILELQVGKKKYLSKERELTQLIERAMTLSDDFLELTEEDSVAFDQVLVAYQLPKNSEREQDIRQQAVDEGYIQASLPLLKISHKLLELLSLYEAMIELKVSGTILSDALMGVQFIQAAAISAQRMIENNLAEVRQKELKKPVHVELEKTTHQITKKTEHVRRSIESYLKNRRWQGE